MKKKFLITLLKIISVATISANKMMIPFEQNGKIGFVNENMEVIFYPEYSKILNYSKQGFYVIEVNSNNHLLKHELIFSDGSKLALDTRTSIKFIGDEYYVIFKDSKSIVYDIRSHKMIKSFDGYELMDSDVEDFIPIINITDETKARYFFIDLKGNEYLSKNDYMRIISHDSKTHSFVFWDKEADNRIADFEGNLRFDKLIGEIGCIGDGLFLGGNAKEQGYYNLKGKLVIPIKGLETKNLNLCPVFCCSVIPCIIENDSIFVQEAIFEKSASNWAIINNKGKIMKKNISADYIFPYTEDNVAIMYKNLNRKKVYSMLDKKGNVITQKNYDIIKEPINGYSRACNNNIDYLISTKDGKEYKVFEILIRSRKD